MAVTFPEDADLIGESFHIVKGLDKVCIGGRGTTGEVICQTGFGD
jgi:hypothetical protein